MVDLVTVDILQPYGFAGSSREVNRFFLIVNRLLALLSPQCAMHTEYGDTMSIRITATAVQSGRVIEHTYCSETTQSDNVTHEQVGRVAMQCVANARKMQFHMAAPDMWLRVEFYQS